MEKRTTNRYSLNCPVRYRWMSCDARKLTSHGLTRDIGGGGVFVLNPSAPPIGTPIELSIAIPNLSGTAHGIQLAASGTVIRVEHQGDYASRGFAAAVRFEPIAGEDSDTVQPTQEKPTC